MSASSKQLLRLLAVASLLWPCQSLRLHGSPVTDTEDLKSEDGRQAKTDPLKAIALALALAPGSAAFASSSPAFRSSVGSAMPRQLHAAPAASRATVVANIKPSERWPDEPIFDESIPDPVFDGPGSYTGRDYPYGFVPNAELLNGRFAMIGFVLTVLQELITGKGVIEFWGLPYDDGAVLTSMASSLMQTSASSGEQSEQADETQTSTPNARRPLSSMLLASNSAAAFQAPSAGLSRGLAHGAHGTTYGRRSGRVPVPPTAQGAGKEDKNPGLTAEKEAAIEKAARERLKLVGGNIAIIDIPDDFFGYEERSEIELIETEAKLAALSKKWERLERQKVAEDKALLGWTKQAEINNGRFAMFFLATGLATEFYTGQNIPEQVYTLLEDLAII